MKGGFADAPTCYQSVFKVSASATADNRHALVHGSAGAGFRTDAAKTARYYRQQAAAAYKAKDYAAAIDNLRKPPSLSRITATCSTTSRACTRCAGRKERGPGVACGGSPT